MLPHDTPPNNLPPLNNHIHIYLICSERDFSHLENTIHQWRNIAKSLLYKATIHPIVNEQLPPKYPLNLLQFSEKDFELKDPIALIKPEALIPCANEPEKTAVILAPAAPGFAKTTTVEKLLNNLKQCQIAGLKRKFSRYPLWLKVFHRMKSFALRLLFCIPSGDLCGPKNLLDVFKNWLSRYIFGLRYEDPIFPFVAFRASVLERCWASSRSSFLVTEILAKSNFLGYLFAEEEIWFLDHKNPTSTPHKDEALSAWIKDFWQICGHPSFTPKTHQIEGTGEVSAL